MRFFRRRIPDHEIDAELRYHLDQLIASKVQGGLTAEAARREALLEFGLPEPTKEACRDLRPYAAATAAAGSLRQAWRGLARSPGFTTVAILTLALGTGANIALFSLVNAALLRLIPVHEPERLVWFAPKPEEFGRMLNYPFYRSLEGDSRFDGLLCAFPASVSAKAWNGAAERVDSELVSGTYFEVLGVRPYLGRLLTRDDDRVRLGHPVVVASHAYWTSHLGSDPSAVGRVIELNGAAYTLVGVAAPGFAGIEQGYPRSLFVPIQMKAAITPGWDGLDKPLIIWLWVVGRLKPSVDREALGQELNARLHAFQEPYIQADRRLVASQRAMMRQRTLTLEPLRDAVLATRTKQHLRTLAWIVLGVLVVTCANLAGLLLVRGLQRRKELATRLALGSSRGRVIAHLVMESVLIGAAGGLVGLVLGASLAPLLASGFPLLGEGSKLTAPLDLRVLGFALVLSLGTCLVFGVAPAWQSTRLDLVAALKGGESGPKHTRMRHGLLAVQTGAALLLLAAAGLFAVNLRRLFTFDAGFAVNRLLIAEMEPTLNGYDGEQRLALYRGLDRRLKELAGTAGSGIRAAALSNVAPISPYYWSMMFLRAGRTEDKELVPRAVAVGPGYFETMGIPLRRGRVIAERDDVGAARVAVISESLARRAYPGVDPIGQRFVGDLRKPLESTFEIAGVVADVQLSDPRRRVGLECVYVPYRQWPFPAQAIVVQLRLTGAAEGRALEVLRGVVRELDPKLGLYDVRTSEQALARTLSTERLASWLSGFFAVLAVLLVGTGLYGLLAREAAARRKEFGVRSALGADGSQLLWVLVRGVMVSVAVGLAAGLLALGLLRPVMTGLLVDSRWAAAWVVAGAVGVLVVTVVAAAWVPGRGVARVETGAALRYE
ncbi:ADOP family duplicated permease [Paludibaculum fermentans]|uniref:ADOP family duplicated permease n=1 Tax=Paludibaculum fermentans TaxID=1473598 RepID=UPI003EBCDC09